MPTPGIGIGDVAEFRGGLDRVAEVTANLLLPLRRRQHADPVAEFQHQVGGRDEVGVIAANVQQMRAGRHRKVGQRDAHYGGLADEDPDVIEVGTIACEPAR
jgi:hypothetical protein